MHLKIRVAVWITALAVLLAGSALLQISLWSDDPSGYDIYYLFLDGQRIIEGQNPYSRVLEGDMKLNDKYTTYFPGFIGLGALTQLFGLQDFTAWLIFWRWVFLLCNLGITALLFAWAAARGAPAAGFAVASLWTFNRWTLFVVHVLGMDFLPLFLLLVSLALVVPGSFRGRGEENVLAPAVNSRRLWLGLLLFGISLSMKQIAVFLTPIYLIAAWHGSPRNKLRAALLAGAVIAAPVLLTSLPFLFWDLKGFLKSILFSTTRDQQQFFQAAPSLDIYLGLSGMLARIPMLVLYAAIYWAAARKEISFLMACSLGMGLFVAANSIYFDQYMVWAVLPLLAFAVTALPVRSALDGRLH